MQKGWGGSRGARKLARLRPSSARSLLCGPRGAPPGLRLPAAPRLLMTSAARPAKPRSVRRWACVCVPGWAAPRPGWRALVLGGVSEPWGGGSGRQRGALGRQGRAELRGLQTEARAGPCRGGLGRDGWWGGGSAPWRGLGPWAALRRGGRPRAGLQAGSSGPGAGRRRRGAGRTSRLGPWLARPSPGRWGPRVPTWGMECVWGGGSPPPPPPPGPGP